VKYVLRKLVMMRKSPEPRRSYIYARLTNGGEDGRGIPAERAVHVARSASSDAPTKQETESELLCAETERSGSFISVVKTSCLTSIFNSPRIYRLVSVLHSCSRARALEPGTPTI